MSNTTNNQNPSNEKTVFVIVDDSAIAAELQAIDTLENAYGFTPDVACRAVDAVGPDVTAAYNYILDEGLADDQGGPIFPISDCPHVFQHVLQSSIDLILARGTICSFAEQGQGNGTAKSDTNVDGSCPSLGENWVCLQCGVVRCSRYVNGHALAHYKDTIETDPGEDLAGHCVGVSLADLSVWCHSCQAYLVDPVVQGVVTKLQDRFFNGESE